MYENQVHEDIINEVEEHIGKLRRANITREEEVTGGLIPKYEALLKLAREHTKGSDVKATELADTLNDLVWAAHDGNLDTKQFISTVRVIAEEIISTGKVLNDDMYREYEEFRKMSREETVYVSQEVYDQYVEEYTNAKNLNRACAGKIKIKPYTEGNRTGRALDDFYAELTERFPSLFKEDVDIYHQLYEILNAWQAIQPYTEYYSDLLGVKTKADLEQAALIKAEEILSEVLGITDTVKTIADKYADKLKYQEEHYKEYYRKQAEEGRRKRQEAEEKAIVLKRIQRNTKRFSNMIIEETDQRHIPEKLKKPVMNFLNMVMFENSDGREAYHVNGTLNMLELMYAYKSYYNPSGEAGEGKAEYDEDVAGWIEELAMTFGEHLNINRLDIEDLRKVDTIVQHLAHIIKYENDIFVDGKREKYRELSQRAINEIFSHTKKEEFKTEKQLLDIEYDMLTPIYFFKHIGTTSTADGVVEETLFRLYRDLQNGQDKWYRNIKNSKELLAEIKQKHNYTDSWRTETTEFELDSGEKIKLTPEEVMYMKALYVRESKHMNNINHLLSGGIVIESDGRLEKLAQKKDAYETTKARRQEFKEAGGYSSSDICNALRKKLTADDLLKIFNSLTDDMIGYQESLVRMLSTTGAEMGNEVSMELLGIKKFNERYYIPISVAEDVLQFSSKQQGAVSKKLKNRSFTKRTTKDARATVYVRSITDIAGEHMQEMSLYNAMTIPVENITRVFNYQKPNDEFFDKDGNLVITTGETFKQLFRTVFGDRGINYLEDFLEDINGGNQLKNDDMMSAMISKFKKAAVTGSLSVAIQQPSAIVRATALIDPKYFVTKVYSKADYEELLECCPVAGIKELGRFDMGTGVTATEWIVDRDKTKLEVADDVLSFLPGWMDRRTWVYIWSAVKRETRAKNRGVSEEEILELAAKRFRDVIDYTQVYDSTLSRSSYMRKKGSLAKMATSFLAEPTLSYNMLRDGLINAKKDKKQAARSVAAFAGATLFNALLKTIITALRHDDEETNYFEVYLSEMPQNFLEDIVIVNSLPVVKDVISIFRGYDVNRSDMTLFSNLYNACKAIAKKDHVPTLEEIGVLLGSISAFTGVPVNNVIKDITAVVKTVKGLGKSPEFSWDVLGQTISEALISEKDDSVKIYRAILNGNKDITERYLEIDDKKVQEYVKQGYSEADALKKVMDNTESSFHSKVVSGLVSEDIRIEEAALARLDADTSTYEALVKELTEVGFDKNDVIKAVEKYISSMGEKTYQQTDSKDKTIYTSSDLTRFSESYNLTASKKVIASFREDGKEDGDIRKILTGVFKPKYIEAWKAGNDSEVQKILSFLESCDVGYSSKQFNAWEKEANAK